MVTVVIFTPTCLKLKGIIEAPLKTLDDIMVISYALFFPRNSRSN
jgi:hypothetical protein